MLLDEQKIYTVSELNGIINAELSESTVRVRGEVSGFKKSQNGKFIYFDLKDEGARMNCFIMAFQLRQELEDGMEVVAQGSPGLYVPYGKYTFRVRALSLLGEGALRRAFELTKRKLEAEGLFREEYKKPLPRFPQRIGLITSRQAAAHGDFLKIARNRWRGLEIFFCNVHVQGAEAVDEIVEALRWFNTRQPVDVLVLTRGGGSLEDLQAFNTESVARAVFASRIPIVVGVGHERDVTLADLAADRRASTPSNAAEIVVPDRRDTLHKVAALRRALGEELEALVRDRGQRLRFLVNRLERCVLGHVEDGRILARRLDVVFRAYLGRLRTESEQRAALLRTLNPEAILARGYSITTRNGTVLKDAALVRSGEQIETHLHRGSVTSEVR